MSVLILGGGLAGLSAATNLPLGCEATLLEKESTLGGLLRTDRVGEYLFDHGPHLFFHTDPYFLQVFHQALEKVGVLQRPARTGQRSFEKLIDFPYSMHLKGLPAEVVAKCVADFAQRQVALAGNPPSKAITNYEEHCRHYFGDGFTDHFMIPYAVKIWTVHPRELSTDWVGGRIVLPNLEEVIRGALLDRNIAGNYIKDFRYPKFGGTQSFVDGVVGQLDARINVLTKAEVREINLGSKSVALADGRKFHYERLISSLPLPLLKDLIVDLPASIREALGQLDWFSVLLLNFGVGELVENPYQWVYFDQSDAVFHRIHFPSKLADHMTPSGHHSIQAEISFSKHRSLPGTPDGLLERAWGELKQAGFVSEPQPMATSYRPLEFAYAIMDHRRERAVRAAREFLASKDFTTCGRFGEWDYIWTDKVLHSGKRAAESLAK